MLYHIFMFFWLKYYLIIITFIISFLQKLDHLILDNLKFLAIRFKII